MPQVVALPVNCWASCTAAIRSCAGKQTNEGFDAIEGELADGDHGEAVLCVLTIDHWIGGEEQTRRDPHADMEKGDGNWIWSTDAAALTTDDPLYKR